CPKAGTQGITCYPGITSHALSLCQKIEVISAFHSPFSSNFRWDIIYVQSKYNQVMYPVPDRFECVFPEAVDGVICKQHSVAAVPVVESDDEIAGRLVCLVPDFGR